MILDIQRVALSPQINQLLLFSCAEQIHQGDVEIVGVMYNTITKAACETHSGCMCLRGFQMWAFVNNGM